MQRRLMAGNLADEFSLLGGVELLAAGAEETILKAGDDLILSGEFGFEKWDAGDLAFQGIKPSE